MRDFDLELELSRLPGKPGVYIMHSSDDTVIYVGKAKVLKNRVRQYFFDTARHTPKVRAMVSNIAYFEYIITDSEIEALVLECNLIKKYKPKYNILLKDDKQYPYIKVTINERYPRLMMTRTLKKDGAKYFGPYAGTATVHNVIELASKIFRPPTCARRFPEDIGKGRPCLNYHIKTCFAPCTGNVSEEEYRRIFYSICDFIGGDHKTLVKDLTEQMNDAARALEYERAADLRDKITAIGKLDEKQKIINSDHMTDMDLAASAVCGDNAFCEIFFVRGGKVIGRENFRLDGARDMPSEEVISEFLKQFYRDAAYIPPEILTDAEPTDAEVIEQWLSERRTKRVKVYMPQRGEKKRIIEMVRSNAETARDNYLARKAAAEQKSKVSEELAKAAGLGEVPLWIEAYDISNISGTDNVGSMVVFKNGKPCRSRYRSFNIKSFEGANDYRAMQEVLYRRLKNAYDEREKIDAGELEEKDARFLPLPDVMLIDGGSGHLAAAKEMLEMMSADIPAFGMVKDDRHRTRALVNDEGELALSPTGSVFKLITAIQDEAHRSAITHHRKKRGKNMLTSELDEIPGIGRARREMLLKSFKSVEGVRTADIDELKKAGLDAGTARSVYLHFHAESTENDGR